MTSVASVASSSSRVLAVVVHDWPAVAAQVDGDFAYDTPIVVLHANRVISASASARQLDVINGLRKREAQARCPNAVVVARDTSRDARVFLSVVDAIAQVAANLEIAAPGVVMLPAVGPARFFGGEAEAVERIRQAVVEVLGPVNVGVGIAQGASAAQLAAMVGVVVPDEQDATNTFLSPLPVRALVEGDLADLLVQLGIRTLGDFAAVPPADVLARFGQAGAEVHALARGMDDHQLQIHRAPPQYDQRVTFDPPSDLVQPVVFCARQPVQEMVDGLAALGFGCRSVVITAQTEHGETLSRTWRHAVGLDATRIVERIRWQLDGWINGTVGDGSQQPTAGISLLHIDPIEVVVDGGYQPAFWGGANANDDRAAQGFARVVGLCGPDAVQLVAPSGGRGVDELAATTSWASGIEDHPSGNNHPSVATAKPLNAAKPWPGALPTPHPLVVYPTPLPATVLDVDDQVVNVSSDAQVSAEPYALCFGDASARRVGIAAWAGPWPVQERWWDRKRRRRYARLQLVDDSGTAYVVQRSEGRWYLTAMYD